MKIFNQNFFKEELLQSGSLFLFNHPCIFMKAALAFQQQRVLCTVFEVGTSIKNLFHEQHERNKPSFDKKISGGQRGLVHSMDGTRSAEAMVEAHEQETGACAE